jgi:hypothetical protein
MPHIGKNVSIDYETQDRIEKLTAHDPKFNASEVFRNAIERRYKEQFPDE